MFNSYSSSHATINNNVHLKPACVGTLQKSHNKSKFKRFHVRSDMATWAFSEVPHLSEKETDRYTSDYDYYNSNSGKYVIKGPEIVILQVMCFGDEELMIEYVLKSDYDATDDTNADE